MGAGAGRRWGTALQTAETIIVTMKTAVIVTPFYFTINAKLNWNTVEMTSQPAIMVTINDARQIRSNKNGK